MHEDECVCGHMEDEHEEGEEYTRECTVRGCDCLDFEPYEGEEDEDDIEA